MTRWVLLVRHASAGSRRKWRGPDDLRPLDKKGRRQAEALPGSLQFALDGMGRVLSSPYLRCVETVDRLAQAVGVSVGKEAALAEGHDRAAAGLFWSLVRGGESSAALCTHGDIIPFLLDEAAGSGIDLGPSPRYPKGSVWAFEVREGSLAAARYVAPAS